MTYTDEQLALKLAVENFNGAIFEQLAAAERYLSWLRERVEDDS